MNSEEKRVKIEDFDPLGDGFGFRCKWEVVDHWADVTVYDVVSYSNESEGSQKFFNRKGYTASNDHVSKIEEAEPYLEGFVKWDGCTELNQGQPHWCGPSDYKKHIAILKYIWIRSHQLMGREPEETW